MNKTVLVTGGSGDIGRAICREYASLGYNVAIHYNKNASAAQKLAQELSCSFESRGCRAMAVPCDIKDEKSVDEMFSAVENQLGQVTCLINNAGISQIKLFDEISLEDWNNMIGVNLTGCFLASRRCIKNMIREKSGNIINISSMWGQVGASCETHYSASKGGMIALTKALAQEVAPSSVRVNCICPGVIDTKMNGHLSPAEMEDLKAEIPLGILGTGEDVAKACSFLSENAPFITGQVIGVNGGMII